MVLSVTFDTNVLDRVCRPDRFPKDPERPQMDLIHKALQEGRIEGFYPVTMLTIEGVAKKDRSKVFGGTKLTAGQESVTVVKNKDLPKAVRDFVGENDITQVTFPMKMEQPDRQPLHQEIVARVNAAHKLGFKALKPVPRTGAFALTDPENKFYATVEDITVWQKRAFEVADAIENRDVGFAKVKELGKRLGVSDPEKVWFRALELAKDIHAQREVEKAFAEWADGDSIASHIAHGIDLFCSTDSAKRDAHKSVFDSSNRKWLETDYGVRFVTLQQVASQI